MLAGTIASALLFAGRQGGAYAYVIGGVFGLSSLGMLATSMMSGAAGKDRSEVRRARVAYLHELDAARAVVRDRAIEQRAALLYRHPPPEVLITLVGGARMWERRPHDADFAAVRIGRGPQALSGPLVPAAIPEPAEPIAAQAARRLAATYATVADVPVAMAVGAFRRIRCDDPALVRALIAQLAFAHAPGELTFTSRLSSRRNEWDVLKWLPHTRSSFDDSVMTTAHPPGNVGRDVAEGHGLRVVIVEEAGTSAPGRPGTCVIELADVGAAAPDQPATAPLEQGRRTAIDLHCTAAGRLVAGGNDVGVPDRLSVVEFEALARALAGYHVADVGAAASGPRGPVTLDDVLGLAAEASQRQVPDLPAAIAAARRRRQAADRLRVPIGQRLDGTPVLLDLKEAALDGMGPHGLLIGATGSGKSELLRTLVLGLATTHESAELNFVLIDFKGGATFASLDRLPHTAAVITNLADELPLVDRMTEALGGELVRRQEALRAAGNLASLQDYERVRAADPSLPAMPALLVVCDEFSELLSAKPDFIDLFVAIGRLGRSLGVHLLLASQRLDEGRLRGLDTHLSYRIGLRTFSATDSRAVLGVPDAYELPRTPGHGFLKFGTEPLVRFVAAYSSGPYRPGTDADTPTVAASAAPTARRIVPFTLAADPVPSVRARPAHDPDSADRDGLRGINRGGGPGAAGLEGRWPDRSSGVSPDEHGVDQPGPQPRVPSLMDVLVGAMDGRGTPAHRVWLPPLSTSAPLDELLGPTVQDPHRGLTVVDAALRGRLRVPVGSVDRPFEQRRDPLFVTLDAAGGHVAIAGGPQAGKSTLLRTLICALALTHTPAEAAFYCLDFGGGALGALRDLPHVGGVAGRQAAEVTRRTLGEVAALLARREQEFAAAGIDTMAAARPSHGDVFLVIDGWSVARSDVDDLEPMVTDLATRGLAYGVHVVLTSTRWADLRPALRDAIGTRIELRLGDPSDSQIGRRAAAMVPAGAPGRGVTADEKHFLAATPQLAEESTADLVTAVAAAWSGPCAPRVRALPATIRPADLPTPPGELEIVLGLAESDLGPVSLDFAAEPHLVIFGEPGSGKSAALRLIATALAAQLPPERARIVMIDYRRSMLGEFEGEHLIGYATGPDSSAPLLASVATYMARRLPGPGVTPHELRERSWWTGPDCFVLIDDYDLVAGSTGGSSAGGVANPALPFLEFVPQALDVGLHLIIARRSGGAGRSLYDPLIARIREAASPGLVLSGEPDEGPLVADVRPRRMQPGRGILHTRRDGARVVQLAYAPPTDI